MRKLLPMIFIMMPTMASAQVISKNEWLQQMKSVIPTSFCQTNQYFRQYFRVTVSECQETAYVATLTCINEYETKIPKQLKQPADGGKWGAIIGSCVDSAYQTTLKIQNKKNSELCNDIRNWIK
jgi:hypothetical protein